MDIQRLQPSLSGPRPAAGAQPNRIEANPTGRRLPRPASPASKQSKVQETQVTSDAALQSVLSAEETQALSQVFAAFRSAAENNRIGNYTGRGTVPRLPPLGGGRPGQLIDVVG